MLKKVLGMGLGISVIASTLMAAPEKTKLKIGFLLCLLEEKVQ